MCTGGKKWPHVKFKVAGIWFDFDPILRVAKKIQARDVLVFKTDKEVLDYIKGMEAMKMKDPNYRGGYDE